MKIFWKGRVQIYILAKINLLSNPAGVILKITSKPHPYSDVFISGL